LILLLGRCAYLRLIGAMGPRLREDDVLLLLAKSPSPRLREDDVLLLLAKSPSPRLREDDVHVLLAKRPYLPSVRLQRASVVSPKTVVLAHAAVRRVGTRVAVDVRLSLGTRPVHAQARSITPADYILRPS